MSSFDQTRSERFPHSLPQDEYLRTVNDAMAAAGFTRENTLAAIGCCRDELASPLLIAVQARWGPAFTLSGLAGLLSAGPTGVQAALAHVPDPRPRSHFVLIAMAHVGIGPNGEVGMLDRPEVETPQPTCGALGGVLAALKSGRLRDRLDPSDLEQSNLEIRIGQLLAQRGDADPVRDLADLAEMALECAEADVDAVLDRLHPDRDHRPLGIDGALLTGIQIHGPGGENYVAPSRGLLDVGGDVTPVFP